MPRKLISEDFLRPEFLVQLGWLVDDPLKPHQNHHATPVPLSQSRSSPQPNFRALVHKSKDLGFEAILTRFFSSTIDTSRSSSKDVSSAVATTYTLDNSEHFFDSIILSNDEAKVWLESTIVIKDRKAYLVVGYQTLQDASIAQKIEHSHNIGGNAQGPPLAAVTGGIESLAVGDLGDVGLGAHINNAEGIEVSYLAPGERIYAVEYRVVHFKWYRKKDIKLAVLEQKSWWESLIAVRGERKAADDEIKKTIVGARLIDDAFEPLEDNEVREDNDDDLEDLEDLDHDGDEEGRDAFVAVTVGDDTYYLPQSSSA
jgi:hypothetical protein